LTARFLEFYDMRLPVIDKRAEYSLGGAILSIAFVPLKISSKMKR